jgi:methyltransferase family protein
MRQLRFPADASGIELGYPAYIARPSHWLAHAPFSFWLMEAHKPRSVVELGLDTGNSYFAFLQAAQTLGLETTFCGVSFEEGPAGKLDPLRAFNDRNYGSNSRLVIARPDDAPGGLVDGRVDILHINAIRPDETLRHFERWLPAMSDRGIVLLHGIQHDDRLRALWSGLSSRFRSFAFEHEHGLGVAYVGSAPHASHLDPLFGPNATDSIAFIRAYFSRLGISVLERLALRQAEADVGRLEARLAHVPSPGQSQLEYGVESPEHRRDIALRTLRQHTIDAMRLEKERRVSLGQYLTSVFARHAPRGVKRLVPPTVKRYLLRLVFGS